VGEIEEFARATRRARTIKIGIVGLLVLSPLIWVGYKNFAKRQEIAKHEEAYRERMKLTADEKAKLPGQIAELRTAVTEAIATFAAQVTPEKLDALEDAGADCAYRVEPASADYHVYAQGQTVTPRASYVIERLDEIAKRVTAGTADRSDLDTVWRYGHSVERELFIIGTRTDPIVTADSYLPGTVTGFAYLYSYAKGKVVCFTSLAVQNSPAIDIAYTHMEGNIVDEEMKKREAAEQKLSQDLDLNVRNALAARLRATL
jgi:hypothetical protein